MRCLVFFSLQLIALSLCGQSDTLLHGKPPLGKPELRWFRKQGVELTQYKWHHPQTRELVGEIRRHRWSSHILLGSLLGFGGYQLGRIVTSKELTQPRNAGGLQIDLGLPTAARLRGISIALTLPLYLGVITLNGRFEKKLKILKECTECKFP